MKQMTRRELIKKTGTLGGVFITGNPLIAGLRDFCGLTPAQTEGPFYPVVDQTDKDWDLTQVKGKSKSAKGQVVWITGTVTDENCRPVEKALVEIWQAAFSGRYHHPGDDSGLELDPNFQYWGKSVTDPLGQYQFKTIVPGHYPADAHWIRPPHIHYKVFATGFHDLTTQMYFSGSSFMEEKGKFIDELNRKDRVLNQLSSQEQQKVIVTFSAKENDLRGTFDITLKRI